MVSVFVGCASGSDEDESLVAARRCEQLRDHVVELNLADASEVDRAAHGEAMRRALGSDFVVSCGSKLSETQVKCALNAVNSSAVAACTTLRN